MKLENSGKNCWDKCNGQGKCDWCGKGGYCCRKGWDDTSHGCDGSFGGVGHACALKPKCGIGGFQLEFVSISRVINHMTCYKLSSLIG